MKTLPLAVLASALILSPVPKYAVATPTTTPHPYDVRNWGFATLFTVDFRNTPIRVIAGCHTRRWGMPDFQDEEVHEAVPNSIMDDWITEACNEPLDKSLNTEEWL